MRNRAPGAANGSNSPMPNSRYLEWLAYRMTSQPPLCVFCRRQPVDEVWRPFCSERCKLQDLARWADGAYKVAGEPMTDPDDGESEKSDV